MKGVGRSWVPFVGAFVLVLLVPIHPVSPQSPQGLGLSPAQLAIQNAQPGESYLRHVEVQNQFDSATNITVTTNGDSGAWTTVSPGPEFTMLPRSAQRVALTVQVPDAVDEGSYSGEVHFTTEPKSAPTGTGAATRSAVALRLDLIVNGTAAPNFVWTDPRVADVGENETVRARVEVRNEGNVEGLVAAEVRLRDVAGGAVIAAATQNATLSSGEETTLEVVLPSPGRPASYVAEFESAGPPAYRSDVVFNVVLAGQVAPHGTLRAIRHLTPVQTGTEVSFDAWFENTGPVNVTAAQFVGAIRRDGELVEYLRSPMAPVKAGAHLNLSATWPAAGPATYQVQGHVEFDGFRTLESATQITVQGKAAPAWFWFAILAVSSGVAALGWFLVRSRRASRPAAGKPPFPRPSVTSRPSSGRALRQAVGRKPKS